MRLRPYNDSDDFSYLQRWIGGERDHALWCADLIPYPVTPETFSAFLKKDAEEWGTSAYTAVDDRGIPVGFFCYSVNAGERSGFLKLVIVDTRLRGQGYGGQMLRLALKYAFEATKVRFVQLNVFDVNIRAGRCYVNLDFTEREFTENAFRYKDEQWGRCNMVISKAEFENA